MSVVGWSFATKCIMMLAEKTNQNSFLISFNDFYMGRNIIELHRYTGPKCRYNWSDDSHMTSALMHFPLIYVCALLLLLLLNFTNMKFLPGGSYLALFFCDYSNILQPPPSGLLSHTCNLHVSEANHTGILKLYFGSGSHPSVQPLFF